MKEADAAAVRRLQQQQDKHDIIDLTDISSAVTENRYICKKCLPLKGEQLLVAYPQAQIQNPFAGPSYKCPVCNTVYDSSLVKLPRISRKVRSTIGSEQESMSDFIIATVPEDKGLLIQDEYERYDPEPGNDDFMQQQGFHIIDSRIELTDSSGHNRTIVRRNTPKPDTSYY